MGAWVQRYWEAEFQPVLADWSVRLGLVSLVGTALLMNKRYLCDKQILVSPESRWLALLAWLLASALLLVILGRARSRLVGALLGLLLGLGLMAALMSVHNLEAGWPPRWRSPLRQPAWLMLAMAWVVAAPAMAAAWQPGRRPRAALLLAALAALAVVVMLAVRGPWRPMLADYRFDKLNWGLLTGGWLLLLPLVTTWGTLGGRLTDDGGGLGRWRFWLPPVLLMLAFMMAVIIGYAGRQRGFYQYYPMFRQEWFDYRPERDGWAFFAVYEVTYAVYFLAWEYFFRGWMLFRLAPELGARAILVQAVPFVFLHIGKPPLEFHSSLIAALALGWLAWRARSFWPCFILHFGAAFTMDITALLNGLKG